MEQCIRKELLGEFIDDVKTICSLLLLFKFRAGFFFLNFYIVFCCKPFQRFYITVFFMFHQKTDGVSTSATAKTLVNLFCWRNSKGRRFFVVKRTQTDIIRASFFQLYK